MMWSRKVPSFRIHRSCGCREINQILDAVSTSFFVGRLQNASSPAKDIILRSPQNLIFDIWDMKKREQDCAYRSRAESSKKYRANRKTLQAQIEEDLSKTIEKVFVLKQERAQILSTIVKQQVLYFPLHIAIYRKNDMGWKFRLEEHSKAFDALQQEHRDAQVMMLEFFGKRSVTQQRQRWPPFWRILMPFDCAWPKKTPRSQIYCWNFRHRAVRPR